MTTKQVEPRRTLYDAPEGWRTVVMSDGPVLRKFAHITPDGLMLIHSNYRPPQGQEDEGNSHSCVLLMPEEFDQLYTEAKQAQVCDGAAMRADEV